MPPMHIFGVEIDIQRLCFVIPVLQTFDFKFTQQCIQKMKQIIQFFMDSLDLQLFYFEIILAINYLQSLVGMSKKSLMETFTRRYSFISKPNSYYVFQKNKMFQSYWRDQMESLHNKLPPNLRLSRLTGYEKMVASAVITFFLTVKYLENFT